MKHTYQVLDMSCGGCEANVKKALLALPDVHKVEIDLATKVVVIEMQKHLSLDILQQALLVAGLHYTITMPEHDFAHHEKQPISVKNGNGVFYCPMFCEEEKTYSTQSGCPICGMDLVEQPSTIKTTQFTCPMHSDIVQNTSGNCPICEMDLVVLETENSEQKTYQDLLKKMKISVLFAAPVFVISMADLIPNNPLNTLMSVQNLGFMQLILTLPIVFWTCWMFFKRAYKSIVTWNLNMFTLVGIGTGAAFTFSVVGLFFPEIFPDNFKAESGTVLLYFEATAVILTLVLLGQLLEAKAHSQTSSALKALLQLAPTTAILLKNNVEVVIAIDKIKKDDLLRVKPGEKIAVDGVITQGESSLDESMISGEPIPVDKFTGDKVTAGSINGNQSFVMCAQKVGSETLLSQIIEMVKIASRSRAPIQKLADTIAKYFVPAVVLMAILTFVVWVWFGPEPALAYGFVNAVAVLIIACPCALGLATPMSVMVGVGKGAQAGVLIKNAQVLEIMDKVDVLIVDKTGTLTQGKPSVEEVFAQTGSADDLLCKIASLNQYSEHPLAQAMVQSAKEKNISPVQVVDFKAITGKGVVGVIDKQKITLGNLALMTTNKIDIDDALMQKVTAAQEQGKTVSYIGVNNKALGYVAISDSIKPSSKKAITELMSKGVHVIMMTGDNQNTAKAVADALNLSDFQAQCLPEDKLNKIKQLQAQGKIVAMAGDGVNDSPALAQADVGIAMGTGTDVAIQSAEITLIRGDLYGIVKAKKLSYAVMKNIKQNLFFAFIYNILGVPIAAGVLFPIFGVLLSPMIAATAMSFSSVSVITNALRLRKISL
ncbi:Lead, cadmium, zinc and mercury transporting ATPase (EC 3.6.3.3) (EC 3.6.3.5); Copper-translocating P-type ATPase (EC 3.6.3.4) [uncultured Gammaproteobacteria bacterium]|jgi:Cu2+-exporting ATPase|nr:Lead, cadmium, zinc and mercury transporting ATPase (EC 3.6.3.3) (EC 3.6.3.5); Copper-translocating P-type ATPase (EC 3.6.3.4) [uncultured Gammaproteobacteria bacterium]CAC9579504.1 Lead, cadmium, zinc and mercury transporting ATPase (EC 3.6.3.3) (EC 3.6.3.5); Copper-translocating P-type ATPase (EC 3.6.3.4) [uncultured Gammaproteobacteria bacterium]CAC9591001.1 Lead, cadmium, zinc and mercury transporting ATPase (EC 3.6.3.3) (EC 3.6.3.5); Copper-translocating P-type ATPase (EC 3.6.3.4) [uncult